MENKDYAIYCFVCYGPYIGYDFKVDNDFKALDSNLGGSYDLTGYDV